MPNPEITLCGRLGVRWDGEQIEDRLPGRQGRLIFAYLVFNRSRAVRRDELVEALWSEGGLPDGGEALLAPPLSRLRKALGPGRLEGRGELSLNLGSEAVIDWEVAQENLDLAQRKLEAGRHEEAWEAALEADATFGGGLLPGFEARWIEEHRSHMEELHLRALEVVARAGSALGDARVGRAERAARTAVEASPFRESARAALMEVLERQGNVAEAVRCYEDLRVLLRDELGTYPAPELNAIHERLLKAPESPRGSAARPVSPPPKSGEHRRSSRPVGGEAVALQIDPRIAEIGLVGRAGVLRQLHDELDKAVAGDLRVALLAGEGGVGKTRIAAELAGAREDVTVLYGRCDPDEVRPFRVWSGLLRSALGQGRELDPAEVVGADGPTLARLLPELVTRMDLPAPGPTTDLESERRALFGAVVRMIGRLTAIRPMLIILDDLQWADRSTLRLLASLAGDDPLRGVLAVGIYRDTEIPADGFLPETLADLQRRRPTVRIEVDALQPDDVRTLIEARVDGDLAARIHDQTGGNPFFIEQLVRHLEETGEADPSLVPGEIREVIRQRVARLSEGGPGLLARAAVIGRDFDLEILMRTTNLGEDDAIHRLDEAVAAGLLDESSSLPGRYSFVHELLRSTLENELSLTRRTTIHRDVGKALEQRDRSLPEGRRDRDLASLAWHFSLAGPGEVDRAIQYSARAAEQAESRLAYDEAVDFYAMAIERCREDEPVDCGLLATLLLGRAEAEWRLGMMQPAGDTFFEAASAARESGLPELVARAAIGTSWGSWESFDTDRSEHIALLDEALGLLDPGDSPLRARVMAHLAHVIYFGGGTDGRAIDLVEESMAMAGRLDDPAVELEVLTATQFFMLQQHDRQLRLASSNRCVEIAERSSDPEDLAEALAWRSVTWINAGRGAEAAADQARHAALNRTLPQITVARQAMRAVNCFIEGRWAEGEQVTLDWLERDITQSARIAMEDALLYMLRAPQGRLGDYVALLEERAAIASPWDIWPAWDFALMLAHWQAGNRDHVRETLADVSLPAIEPELKDLLYLVFCGIATMLATEMDDREMAEPLARMMRPFTGEWVIFGPPGSTFGPVDLLLGEVELIQGRHREAATAFENAIVTCEDMRALPFLARAQLGLAEALRHLGDPDGKDRTLTLHEAGKGTALDLGMKPLLNRFADS